MIQNLRKLVPLTWLLLAAGCATSPAPSPSGSPAPAASPGATAGAAPAAGPAAPAYAGPPPKPVVAPTTPPAPPDVNPFKGARFYLDPEFARMVEDVAAKTPAEAKRLRKLASYPVAVWLETVETAKLAAPTMEAAAKQGASSKGPVVPVFVVYDLPNRDCAAEGTDPAGCGKC